MEMSLSSFIIIHHHHSTYFTITMASVNAYFVKVQTAGVLKDRCFHVRDFRDSFQYKMHILFFKYKPSVRAGTSSSQCVRVPHGADTIKYIN